MAGGVLQKDTQGFLPADDPEGAIREDSKERFESQVGGFVSNLI